MKGRLVDIWLRMQASYWFIPGLLSAGAVIAAAILVRIDYALGDTWLETTSWLRVNQAEGARTLLAAVAGSMITVAGVTFSMTLLAVSHATSHIGAHLLSAFMRDRGNQLTLGTFIATFLYCLMLLRSVHSGDETAAVGAAAEFVPHLAVNGALVLAMLSVVVLIYFIHHVPQSINVANVVARVGNDLIWSIHSLYPENLGSEPHPHARPSLEDGIGRPVEIPVSHAGGYLRVIDNGALMEEACKANIVIEICKRPGEFGLPGEPLMRIHSRREVDDELAARLEGCFSWGNERTPNQDVLLPVHQLLEIIGRALSPGINNQYAALLCIDQLGHGAAEMLGRAVPDACRLDSQGDVRVVAEPVDHESFMDAAWGPLEQYVRDDDIARTHVEQILKRLESLPDLRHARALIRQAAARFDQR